MNRVAFVSLLVLAVAASGCRQKKQEDNKSALPLVKVAPATSAEVDQVAEFTGTIQPYQENVIGPASPGRIDEILVDVGARVTKGQLLVKMDGTQYRQTAVQLAQQELDYKRMEAVYQAAGISKQQLDAQLAQVEVSREAAQNLQENIDLRSPLTGVVTGRYYDPGDMYSLSPKDGVTGILTVMQIDRLKVQIHVSEQYFLQVKEGMPADIRLDLFPETVFPAKVTLVYPAIDAATRTFTVEITIPNANLKLRPGMFCRVALNFGKAERVMIPDLAVQKQSGTNEKYVFVVRDSVAHRRTVDVGRQIGKQYEVLSGVTAGEEVVTAGAARLLEDAKVEITQ